MVYFMLTRGEAFVDLYAVVRQGVRISKPSYSIKKLEPLYMGAEVRTSDVQRGDDSIVKYVEARAAIESARPLVGKDTAVVTLQNGIDALAPPHRITEAQAFLHAAMTSGGALGTAVGGVMIDHLGPGGGLLGAIVLIALGSVLCATQLGRWRRLTL